jgi:hypothetical protein
VSQEDPHDSTVSDFQLDKEDRLTRAKWMRGIAAFYGCMVLLVFGLILLTKPSSLAADEAGERQTWSAGLQAERGNPGTDQLRKAQ